MRSAIATTGAPAAIGPYSQAVVHGGLLWCSGQIGLRADGTLADGTCAQAGQALDNLDAVCRAAGTRLDRALRCTVWLLDLAEFAEVNRIYAERFQAPFPARATMQVSALPRGARIEIDAVVPI